jgi:alpha-L-glutamate ligase-like protein
MPFNFYKKGKRILGMNSRNLEYIRPFNLKRAKKIADDKIFSKRILRKAGLPVPKLIAKIISRKDLENFDWNSLPTSFALKPNRGFGGEGILVVYGKKKDRENTWIKADSSLVTVDDLKNHINNIIDGSFSLSNIPDIAFFEERLRLLKLFKPYAYKGIPDIRVIVYNKVPVMAMLRLPTKDSGGKANLQQGAIGVGIDLATGVTTTAVQGKSKIVEYVPETRLLLSGIKIPYWSDILKLAVKAQEASGLGFLGADIAVDKERGPVFLELNARPGLSIQIANLAGLKRRLERVTDVKIKTAERGIRVGMNLFGGEIEGEIEDISGRKVIGAVEKVKLISKEGKEIEVEAKIDTGAYSSSIDTELAKKLGLEELLIFFNALDLPKDFKRENVKQVEEDLRKKYLGKHPDLADIGVVFSSHGFSIRPKAALNFVLDKVNISTLVNIVERFELKKEMIIGRKNLAKFLVDVNKK